MGPAQRRHDHILAARVFLTNRDIVTEEGPIAQHTLGLVLSRHIGGGVHEDLDLTNYARTKVRFNLEIALRSDFADIFEVKSEHFVRRGHIATEWSEEEQRLTTTYRNQDFFREVAVTARNNDSSGGLRQWPHLLRGRIGTRRQLAQLSRL